MRKILLFTAILATTSLVTVAQSKLGLKFSPSISSNRVSLTDGEYDVESPDNSFRFAIGLIYDHEITETYFLSTGLIFTPKQVVVDVMEDDDVTGPVILPQDPLQEYRLNYLQIPVTLKLFTNEVQPDMRIFFQVGLAPEIKVFSEPTDEDFDLIEDFKSFDTSIIFGGGVEYRAGVNTTLFGGFTYQRGLANTIKSTSIEFDERLEVRNTLVSLDLGIKF